MDIKKLEIEGALIYDKGNKNEVRNRTKGEIEIIIQRFKDQKTR